MGGQDVALPRAARVVAYSGRSEGEAGEVFSDAAKASYDGTLAVTMPRFVVPEAARARRDASMCVRCAACEGYSAARVG